MKNIIKINNTVVKNTTTDNNLYNHLGVSTEIITWSDNSSNRFADQNTVENYIAAVAKFIDSLNNLVEYRIVIENCVLKEFVINTTEESNYDLCDLLDELNKKYGCNFEYDCALCCGGSI